MREITDYIGSVAVLCNELETTNRSLNAILPEMEFFEKGIIHIDEGMQRWSNNIDTAVNKFSNSDLSANLGKTILSYTPVLNDGVSENYRTKDEKTLTAKAESALETALSFGEITDNGLTLYEIFEKLPPVLDNVKNGVGIFNGALKAFIGLETLSAATGFAGSIAAAEGIVTGAEGFAAGAPAFGPVGWVAGASAL